MIRQLHKIAVVCVREEKHGGCIDLFVCTAVTSCGGGMNENLLGYASFRHALGDFEIYVRVATICTFWMIYWRMYPHVLPWVTLLATQEPSSRLCLTAGKLLINMSFEFLSVIWFLDHISSFFGDNCNFFCIKNQN